MRGETEEDEAEEGSESTERQEEKENEALEKEGSSSAANAEEDEEESDSDMTGTREFRPLTAQRPSSATARSAAAGESAPVSGSKSLSSRVVEQLSSSLTQIAETQRQQQDAILMLGQRVEAELVTRAADVSLLTNEFKHMRLAAAEERAEILEELRRGRTTAPTTTPWIASQVAAEYAAARQQMHHQQQSSQAAPLPREEAPTLPRTKKREEDGQTPMKTSKGVGSSRKSVPEGQEKGRTRKKERRKRKRKTRWRLERQCPCRWSSMRPQDGKPGTNGKMTNGSHGTGASRRTTQPPTLGSRRTLGRIAPTSCGPRMRWSGRQHRSCAMKC